MGQFKNCSIYLQKILVLLKNLVNIFLLLLLLVTTDLRAASLPSSYESGSSDDGYVSVVEGTKTNDGYAQGAVTDPLLMIQYNYTDLNDLTFVPAPPNPGHWEGDPWVAGDVLYFSSTGDYYDLSASDWGGYLWATPQAEDDLGIGSTDYFLEATVPLGDGVIPFLLLLLVYSLFTYMRKKALK